MTEANKERSLTGSLESGTFDLDGALALASGIAGALAELHERGETHGGLEPDVVLIREDGGVRLLEASDDSEGQVRFSSPERLSGQPLDSRSDVFSFGALLYEMATGRAAFGGDSAQATSREILQTESGSVQHLGGELSPELGRIVARCLARTPDDRYNVTRDLFEDLKVARGAGSETTKSRSSRRVAWRPVVARRFTLGVLALLLLASLTVVLVRSLDRPAPSSREPRHVQLTFSGNARSAVFSPDGRSIAYVVSDGGDREASLRVQDIGSDRAVEVYRSKGEIAALRWWPSTELLVWDRGVSPTVIVPRMGGDYRSLPGISARAWSPDGKRVAGFSRDPFGIRIRDAMDGSEVDFLETGFPFEPKGMAAPPLTLDWSSDGRWLLFNRYATDTMEVWVVPVAEGDGGPRRAAEAADIPWARFSADGEWIYYSTGYGRQSELFRVGSASAKWTEPAPRKVSSTIGGKFDLSPDGTSLVHAPRSNRSNLFLIEANGEEEAPWVERALTTGTTVDQGARLSPDGKWLVFQRLEVDSYNVWKVPLAGGKAVQLTFFDDRTAVAPGWSPDGESILFLTHDPGLQRIWRVDANGGPPEPLLDPGNEYNDIQVVSATRVLGQRIDQAALVLIDLESGEEEVLVERVGGALWPSVAPSGRWVAFSERGVGEEVSFSILDLDSGREEELVRWPSEDNPWIVGWAEDESAVFVERGDALFRVPLDGGGPRLSIEDFVGVGVEADDGVLALGSSKRFVVDRGRFSIDVWLVENFDSER